jgi:phosphate:Na+ symporter
MRIMSDGLQKAAGNKLQSILNYMTSNRFTAVITGFLITAVIQSSSATTVMVVSFANASLLSLTQSIGVILGANIGTTVTTWIVSLLGFKFKISSIALPIIGLALPLHFSKLKQRRDTAEIMIGFGLLFLGLAYLKSSVPDIQHNPQVLEFLANYTEMGFWSYIIFIGVGTALTVIVQSSSAAMAITVTMAFKGWIDFPIACAIVLGENIGTTITAHLASIGTSANARRAARAHFLFNFIGVIWVLLIFKQFIGFIDYITPFWDSQDSTEIPMKLAMFHTLFNLTNTLLFLPLIGILSKIVLKWVKDKDENNREGYRLQYISTGIQDTAQLNVLNAQSELDKMAAITESMFLTFLEIYQNPDKKLGDMVQQMQETENLTDQMQEEITSYLIECTKEDLSVIMLENVNAMLRIVNELENIGDSCMKLTYLLQRRYDKKIKLHPKADEEIMEFSEIILEFMAFYKEQMNNQIEKRVLEIAYRLEDKVNFERNKLRKSATRRLQHGGDVTSELLFMDLLKHFEHIGDNSLNIAQALQQDS